MEEEEEDEKERVEKPAVEQIEFGGFRRRMMCG